MMNGDLKGVSRLRIGIIISLMLVGLTLVILGITFLQSTSDERIAFYNELVSNHKTHARSLIAAWSGRSTVSQAVFAAANATFVAKSQEVNVNGDVTTSFYLQANLTNYIRSQALLPVGNPNYHRADKLDFNISGLFFTRAIHMAIFKNDNSLYCSSASCSDNCNNNETRLCHDGHALDFACQELYNAGANFMGYSGFPHTCNGSRLCGYCSYGAFASSLTVVVDSSSDGRVLTASRWSYQHHTPKVPTVDRSGRGITPITVEVRLSNDPHVVVRNLDIDKYPFGSKDWYQIQDQIPAGLACVILGSLIVVFDLGLIFQTWRKQKNHKKTSKRSPADLHTHREQQLGQPSAAAGPSIELEEDCELSRLADEAGHHHGQLILESSADTNIEGRHSPLGLDLDDQDGSREEHNVGSCSSLGLPHTF